MPIERLSGIPASRSSPGSATVSRLLENAARDARRDLGVGIGKDHRELVAAVTRRHVVQADGLLQR